LLKILITNLGKKSDSQTKMVLQLFKIATLTQYAITNNPKEADLILVCDAYFDNYGEVILKNEILKNYTNKCFLLSNIDRPLPIFRGILTSAEKSFFNFGRVRSCSFTAALPNFKNPFIENHFRNNKKSIEKKFLFSFIGRDSDPIRRPIFQTDFHRNDILIENTENSFNLYNRNNDFLNKQEYYFETLLQSKFALCPRGWGANSYRLFEAMMLGVAPVIISDKWILPKGPDWKSFSLIIPSKHINSLEKVIIENEYRYFEMGIKAKEAFLKYFDDKVFFDYLITNCLEIRKKQLLPESFLFQNISPLIGKYLKLKDEKLKSIGNGVRLILSEPNQLFRKATIEKINRFLSK
jgi:hypothetical protein